MTISCHDALIVGSGRATITRPMGTQIMMEDALLYPNSTRTLLSFRDVRNNCFHVKTHMDNKEEFLLFPNILDMANKYVERFLLSKLDCTLHT